MKKNSSDLSKLANFFYEIGTLRKTARSHRQALLTDDLSDNIASHSYRVTVIGWFLAHLERADPYLVVTMCLFHDISETRSGDQNWIHKRYTKVFEEEIQSDQLTDLPYDAEVKKISKDYNKRKSIEAIVAKDADVLDQILLLKEYAWQGNREAEDWLGKKLSDNSQYKSLKTSSAKNLARTLIVTKPSDWWKSLWTSTRR